MLCFQYLQGPTSSGKTSLVAYLAAQTGHKFVRINNHQHTDLQEYLGSWVPDEQGEHSSSKHALDAMRSIVCVTFAVRQLYMGRQLAAGCVSCACGWLFPS